MYIKRKWNNLKSNKSKNVWKLLIYIKLYTSKQYEMKLFILNKRIIEL